MRKGEIACYKQFLFSSQCFLPDMALIFHYNYLHFKMSSAICFKLDQSNILLSANGLTHYQTTNIRLFQTEIVCRRQFQI